MISEQFFHGKNAEVVSREEQEGLIAGLASAIDTQWIQAKSSGQGPAFLSRIDGLVGADRLPQFFFKRREDRRPPFPEALHETARRLQFVETFGSSPPPSVTGELCGGSMSYGRFYNVRKLPTPSDIDYIVVVDPSFFESDDPEKIVNPGKGFREDESHLFQTRCRRFSELARSGQAHMMSQKFSIEDYEISLKIIPEKIFEWEFDVLPKEMTADRHDQEAFVLDYKAASYPDKDSPRKNFFGNTYVFHGNESFLSGNEAITQVPAAVFQDGTFYTGDHHNHVLPKFEISYDKSGTVQRTLQSFQNLLRKEFSVELNLEREGRQIDGAKIMDRSPYFSPIVLQEARSLFIS